MEFASVWSDAQAGFRGRQEQAVVKNEVFGSVRVPFERVPSAVSMVWRARRVLLDSDLRWLRVGSLPCQRCRMD